MIETLREYGNEQIVGLLSRLALSMMPTPQVDSDRPVPPLLTTILHEIGQQLGLPDTESRDARAKIFDFISTQLSEITLSAADVDQVKSTAGQEGILKNTLYKIEFDETFKQNFLSLGVRQTHVENAIHYPHDYQHLFAVNQKDPSAGSFSIYMQTLKSNAFTFLVVSKRRGYLQWPSSAWRLYHSKIGRSDFHSPLDALQSFALHYGRDIRIGPKVSKFFVCEEIPLQPGQTDLVEFMMAEPEGEFLAQHFTMVDEENIAHISYAYAIDLLKYRNDLPKR